MRRYTSSETRRPRGPGSENPHGADLIVGHYARSTSTQAGIHEERPRVWRIVGLETPRRRPGESTHWLVAELTWQGTAEPLAFE